MDWKNFTAIQNHLSAMFLDTSKNLELLIIFEKKEMTVTDKNILDTYSNLFEGLSSINKIELIERLTKSLKIGATKKNTFYKSFGAFDSDKSAEEIVLEIKTNRKFKNKEIKF